MKCQYVAVASNVLFRNAAAARDNSSHHQSKRDDSCKHMQSVHRGKDVVERAIRIRREVKALRRELPPGFQLPGNENESEREGGHEQAKPIRTARGSKDGRQ